MEDRQKSIRRVLRRGSSPGEELAEQIKGAAKEDIQDRVDFLSTGSHLLNLAASQKGKGGGWARGRIINIVGDKSSGKSLLSLEACAQMFYNTPSSSIYPAPKKISIVYNNTEGVMDFPIDKMYGTRFSKEVEWIQTPTCEEFGRDYQRRVQELKKEHCLLYILDSLDATVSKAAQERVGKSIKDDKETKGSYGVEKAKYFSSEFFSSLCSSMKDKDATLICISQVRENLNVVFGKKYYRAGGKALDFYTHQTCWLYEKAKLKKTVKEREKVYGIEVKCKFEKNKVALPFREADVRILFDYGLDDIDTLISYLYGGKSNLKIEGEMKDQIGQGEIKRQDLIKAVEEREELRQLLISTVEKDWHEIEEGIKPHRKRRFVE